MVENLYLGGVGTENQVSGLKPCTSSIVVLDIFVERGHSITTWTRRGEKGVSGKYTGSHDKVWSKITILTTMAPEVRHEVRPVKIYAGSFLFMTFFWNCYK